MITTVQHFTIVSANERRRAVSSVGDWESSRISGVFRPSCRENTSTISKLYLRQSCTLRATTSYVQLIYHRNDNQHSTHFTTGSANERRRAVSSVGDWESSRISGVFRPSCRENSQLITEMTTNISVETIRHVIITIFRKSGAAYQQK